LRQSWAVVTAAEGAQTRALGSPLSDDAVLALVTTDFLATGGDGFFADAEIAFTIGPPIRDEMAEALRKRGGTLDPDDHALFDRAHPRFDLPTQVPIRCGE
jgi:hypothetical protein